MCWNKGMRGPIGRLTKVRVVFAQGCVFVGGRQGRRNRAPSHASVKSVRARPPCPPSDLAGRRAAVPFRGAYNRGTGAKEKGAREGPAAAPSQAWLGWKQEHMQAYTCSTLAHTIVLW